MGGMLGKRTPQRGLFEADHLYLDHVGRDSFYGVLASQRGQLFRDEDFADLYCRDNGRASCYDIILACTRSWQQPFRAALGARSLAPLFSTGWLLMGSKSFAESD